MGIPRRIIQTAKSRELSPLARAAQVNLRLLHPEWEYLFFDDGDIARFIDSEFPQYKAAYLAFGRPIQRIDFFRYLAVLRYGGFYFDTDVFLFSSVAELTRYEAVFTFEELTLCRHLRTEHDMDWELGNYAFGAAPGNPFLQAVVDGCVRAQQSPLWVAPMMAGIPRFLRSEFNVLNTTGPGLVSRIYAENPGLATAVTILMPTDVCDPASWHQFGNYGVHAMDGSWRDRGSLLWRKLALAWESRVRRRLLAQSRRLGPRRSPRIAFVG